MDADWVYGLSNNNCLEEFLAELKTIKSRRDLPWCIGGDFNEVLYLEERNWAVRTTTGMELFCEFVDSNDLINLPITGARYTWSNFQNQPSLSKLDRFLISVEWDDLFSPSSVHALPRLGSDHMPIMPKGRETLTWHGHLPFKFQNMWLLHPGFVDQVKFWWENMKVQGSPGQRFHLKLKGLRDHLQIWNKEVFRDVERRKVSCLDEIKKWDWKEEEVGWRRKGVHARLPVRSLTGFWTWRRSCGVKSPEYSG